MTVEGMAVKGIDAADVNAEGADVVVLGSLNMDLVAQVSRLPRPGETILGKNFSTVPGGKGANQAVAAVRLGAQTAMIGRVGNDSFGQMLRDELVADKIDVSAVGKSDRAPSGTALIAVAPQNNQIVVVPGANSEVGETALDDLKRHMQTATVLLLQFEVPIPVVQSAAALARKAGLLVIVDPAPARGPLPDQFCRDISILTPNQTEAELLTGVKVTDIESAFVAARLLQKQGVQTVIVKLGELGSVCVMAEGSFAVPAFSVEAIDTIAAGDAFNGGLAAALCRSNLSRFNLSRARQHQSDDGDCSLSAMKSAVVYASAVSAIAVTRSGAQPAMPTQADVDAFLAMQ